MKRGNFVEEASSGDGPNCCSLIWLPANLFSGTLSRQSLLHPPLLARLQVVGVTLHFLNDVFRLNLALESTQGILQRLALLQSNFSQTHYLQPEQSHTPKRSTTLSLAGDTQDTICFRLEGGCILLIILSVSAAPVRGRLRDTERTPRRLVRVLRTCVANTVFTVFRRRPCVRYATDVPFTDYPEFAEVQRELAETLLKLGTAGDSNERRLLLREMRRLLAEADRVVDSQPDAPK